MGKPALAFDIDDGKTVDENIIAFGEALKTADAPLAAVLISALPDLIPGFSDQNSRAQARRPRDMIRQGCSTSLFQASQQWSTISS